MMRGKKRGFGTNRRTQIVSFHLPVVLLKAIDELVEMGVFNNRSEAVRVAVYNLLKDQERLKRIAALEVGYR